LRCNRAPPDAHAIEDRLGATDRTVVGEGETRDIREHPALDGVGHARLLGPRDDLEAAVGVELRLVERRHVDARDARELGQALVTRAARLLAAYPGESDLGRGFLAVADE